MTLSKYSLTLILIFIYSSLMAYDNKLVHSLKPGDFCLFLRVNKEKHDKILKYLYQELTEEELYILEFRDDLLEIEKEQDE